MKVKLLIVLFIIPFLSYSQSKQEQELKKVVEIFFEGFHEKDSVKINSVLNDELNLGTVFFKGDEAQVVNMPGDKFVKAVVTRPESPVWEEKLGKFSFNIDGPFANVWVEYEFYLDGKLLHCGANSFYMLKKSDGWKIFDITDSRRKDCD